MAEGTPITDRLGHLVSLRRIQRFLMTGGLGMVVDMTVLAAVVELGLLRPVFGKLVSAESAFLVMFAVNERWTFSQYGSTDRWDLARRLLTSHGVRIGGVAIATVVLYLLHNFYGVWYLLANAIGICAGVFANYIFESVFTWRVHQEAEA